MSNRSDDGFFKFFSGLLMGGLGGFLAGIMLAQKSGREFRRDIAGNSEEVLAVLKEKFEGLKDKASDQIKDFRGFSDEAFKQSAINIQDKVLELGKQLDQLAEDTTVGRD